MSFSFDKTSVDIVKSGVASSHDFIKIRSGFTIYDATKHINFNKTSSGFNNKSVADFGSKSRSPVCAGGFRMQEPSDAGAGEWAQALDAFLAERGGRHKRARHADHDFRGTKSALGSFLMEEFCFGKFSASQVQTIALLAVQDGARNSTIEKLSKLGTSGEQKGNCWRDLVRYIRTLVEVPEPVGGDIPMILTKGVSSGPTSIKQYYNMPHRWFAHMFKHQRAEFDVRFGASKLQLSKFWRQVKPNDPRRQDNPNMDRPDLRSHGVPF
eukprot:7267735-Pyramimonas_sp.AAC.1